LAILGITLFYLGFGEAEDVKADGDLFAGVLFFERENDT
jgi:hypothetical protein